MMKVLEAITLGDVASLVTVLVGLIGGIGFLYKKLKKWLLLLFEKQMEEIKSEIKELTDKVEKSGLHTVKADVVDAPRVEELPVCIECTLESYEDVHCHLFGNIENVTVDEAVLTDGKVDPAKLKPVLYDIENHLYWSFGKPAGKAFADGKKLVK